MLSEVELLERLRQGDGSAFEKLFLQHYTRIYRVLYHLVGSREEAEDLAQETLLALYNHPPVLKGGIPLGAWLYRVAVNRGYNARRGASRAQVKLERLDPLSVEVDPQAELLRAEERTSVQGALAQLPERQAKLLLLRQVGLSYSEMATALEIAPGSVGTLLVRAERAFLKTYERMVKAEQEGSLDRRKS